MSSSPHILIVGATGKQGGQAASAVLAAKNTTDAGLQLRFVTRNVESPAARALVSKGAEAVKADLLDKPSLVKALQGIDRAFLVTDAGAGEDKERTQGITFVDAAKDAGVKHVVFTSVASADEADKVPHFRSKYQVEQHLQASGLSYTILRPVAFMDNIPVKPGFGRFMFGGLFYSALGWNKCHLIACEDIGVFAGKALLDPTNSLFNNKTINLSAGKYGLDEYAKVIKATQGHDPWFARYLTRGIRSILPYDFKQMMIFLDTKGYPDIDVDALRRIHPKLLSLEDYFRKNS